VGGSLWARGVATTSLLFRSTGDWHEYQEDTDIVITTYDRPGPVRALTAVTVALLVGALTVGIVAADAAPPKKFTMSIDPVSIVVDDETPITFALSNTSPNPISLGSANITIPTGVNVTAVPDGATINGDVIELRDLALAAGSTWTGDVSVTVATCPATFEWLVVAKQANNFLGDGNEFEYQGSFPVLAVTCAEEEDEEPEAFQGPSPQFTPPGGWDAAIFCPGKQACPSPTVTLGNTSATLSVGGNAAAVFLAVKAGNAVPMDCGADFESQSGDIYFDVIGGQRHKTVTIRLFGAAGTDLSALDVCFGADSPWNQADGTPAVYDGSFFWVGLLDDCPVVGNGNRPPGANDGLGRPIGCVLDRFEDGADAVIVVLAPPGDPRIKIG
jgi:hypothetical protein